MPTPEELRERARAHDEELKRQREAKAREEAKQRRERLAEIKKEDEQLIARAETQLEHARAWAISVWITKEHLGYRDNWEVKARREAWERAAQHFRDQGLNAKVQIKDSIEYGSDGGFPGPDTVTLEIDWKEPDDES